MAPRGSTLSHYFCKRLERDRQPPTILSPPFNSLSTAFLALSLKVLDSLTLFYQQALSYPLYLLTWLSITRVRHHV